MKKYVAGLFLSILCSCVSLHTPSPHIVPSITKKNQLEGEACIGMNAAGVNVAYSPLKHLSVMGNAQGLPINQSARNYQRSCEVAIGTYGSRSRFIYGLNGGYGKGVYKWDYLQFNDTTSYSLYTKGNFQKLMLQIFFAFTDNPEEPSWMVGISLKENFYWDQYVSLRYTTHNKDLSGLEKNMSFEPCLFAKNFFTKRFYLNVQAGMNISYDRSMFWPGQYIFSRIGLGMKI